MKDKLMMILFVIILGSILTTSLVLVNSFTTPIIEKNIEIKLKSSVLEALEIPFDIEDVEQTFANNVKIETKEDTTYYISANGDYALPYEGAGLWGPITGILAMNQDLVNIAGLTIMQQEETPGLGSRIAEELYLRMFVGKTFSPQLELVTPGKGTTSTKIDSIAGATMSSKAFVDLLNAEHSRYRDLLGGSK
ncbi:MAG: FMN-binding protein [Spirochaetales bacterium]|jgi:Na+-transporting NADH:ubiquinone oxidoreductase subunit C|nr:FMN-binding protein [Spirochaetales bacterium]